MTEVNKNIDNGKSKRTEILQKTWVVCALALVCTFLWGSASPCIKLGYALFEIPSGETWTQVLFAGMRFVLAGILTVLIGSLLQKKALVPAKTFRAQYCEAGNLPDDFAVYLFLHRTGA